MVKLFEIRAKATILVILLLLLLLLPPTTVGMKTRQSTAAATIQATPSRSSRPTTLPPAATTPEKDDSLAAWLRTGIPEHLSTAALWLQNIQQSNPPEMYTAVDGSNWDAFINEPGVKVSNNVHDRRFPEGVKVPLDLFLQYYMDNDHSSSNEYYTLLCWSDRHRIGTLPNLFIDVEDVATNDNSSIDTPFRYFDISTQGVVINNDSSIFTNHAVLQPAAIIHTTLGIRMGCVLHKAFYTNAV
eukprot:Lankesteria_metandrocarpae@DN2154_c0_g1_i1.p1